MIDATKASQRLLGETIYDPTPFENVTTTSAVLVPVNPLTVTFTPPTSGKVNLVLGGMTFINGGSGTYVIVAALQNGVPVPRSEAIVAGPFSLSEGGIAYRQQIVGLVPYVPITWVAALRRYSGTGSVGWYMGVDVGQGLIRVEAA